MVLHFLLVFAVTVVLNCNLFLNCYILLPSAQNVRWRVITATESCCFLIYMPDCWLEVSIRKVLRPATSTQFFLVFPVPKRKYSDGPQDSKLPLHASHVALPTYLY